LKVGNKCQMLWNSSFDLGEEKCAIEYCELPFHHFHDGIKVETLDGTLHDSNCRTNTAEGVYQNCGLTS
jgi:predicted HD phosphohydrolase